MRKIETHTIREKREQRTRQLLSIVLIALLVLSTAGYAVYYTTSQPAEGQQGIWSLVQGMYSLELMTAPAVARQVPVTISNRIGSIDSQLYLDAPAASIADELRFNIAQAGKTLYDACYGSCTLDLPEKDCTDWIIVWRVSENNKVYQEEKCFFIEGDVSAADAFLLEFMQ